MHLLYMKFRYCDQCKADKLHDFGRATDGKLYKACIRCGKMEEVEDSAAVATPQVPR